MNAEPTFRQVAELTEDVLQGKVTHEDACRKLGWSWEKVQAQVEAERAHFESLGLTYPTPVRVLSRDADLPAVGSFG